MNDKTFSTDAFLLACYLLSEACHLIDIDKTNPNRMIFIFEETNERVKLTQDFLAHQANIEPHRFYSAQRDLKQLIHQIKDTK